MISLIDPQLVTNSTRLLYILSKKDNLTLFLSARDGLKAEVSAYENTGISKKVYYTRLKQLIDGGLIEKLDGKYIHTTLGSIIYQEHITGLIEKMKDIKQMKMVDTLKRSREYSEDDIGVFIEKIVTNNSGSSHSKIPSKVELALTYEDMVSIIVERTEFCKKEILLASRYTNEVIINNILRKAQAGVNVKVLAEKSLVEQFFSEQNKYLKPEDKNNAERTKVIGNPWYPGNVSRRIANLPFSMIIFDRKEIGIELVNAVDTRNFKGVVFLRDDKVSKKMTEYYQEIWNSSDELPMNNSTESSVSKRYMPELQMKLQESQQKRELH